MNYQGFINNGNESNPWFSACVCQYWHNPFLIFPYLRRVCFIIILHEHSEVIGIMNGRACISLLAPQKEFNNFWWNKWPLMKFSGLVQFRTSNYSVVSQPLGYSPGQKQPALENISPIEFLSYRGVACLLGNLRRYIF